MDVHERIASLRLCRYAVYADVSVCVLFMCTVSESVNIISMWT